ncbi:hypothetical protein [Azospirillum largimobile]
MAHRCAHSLQSFYDHDKPPSHRSNFHPGKRKDRGFSLFIS